MEIPNSLRRFAQYFHQDCLDNDQTVKNVLAQITYSEGVDLMAEVQSYLSDSIKKDSLAVMELKWETADSSIDFMEHTKEFFLEVISFDTTRFATAK